MNWPSATQILKASGYYDEYVGNNSGPMQRGRLVVAACHILGQKKELEPAWCDRHPECLPYLDVYRIFLSQHRVQLLHFEREFRCEEERFVTHPDQVMLLDDVEADVEIKTGALKLWVALQTAAQVLAIGKRMKRFGLELIPGARPKLIPFPDPRDLDEFRIKARNWWVDAKYLGERE